MFEKAIQVIQKIQGIINDYHEYFDTLIEWYKDAKLTVKVARLLLHKDEGWPKMIATVNGFRVERSRNHENWQYVASWRLPQGILNQGQNDISIRIADRSGAQARLIEAGVFQEEGMGRQVVSFTGREPTAAHQFSLNCSRGAKRGEHCWTVVDDGMLDFNLDWNRHRKLSSHWKGRAMRPGQQNFARSSKKFAVTLKRSAANSNSNQATRICAKR